MDAKELQRQVRAKYRVYDEGLRNKRVVVPDFREQSGVRLVKFGLLLDPDEFDGEDDPMEAAATDVFDRIVAFEHGLIVGTGWGHPSRVVRCFLKGHDLPDVFAAVPANGTPHASDLERRQIKVRHVFGVNQ